MTPRTLLLRIFCLFRAPLTFAARCLPVRPFLAPEENERTLSAVWPDEGGTALATNKIDATFDLHIIIPAYNASATIDACLSSVVAQAASGYSVCCTVVDDGSTDDTASRLAAYYERFEQAGIVLEVIRQRNAGHSCARNAALRHLRGRYVLFLDSDDRLAPSAIATLMQAAERTGADVVEGGYETFGLASQRHLHASCDALTPSEIEMLWGCPWGKVMRATLFAHVQFPPHYWFEDSIIIYLLFPLASHIATVSSVVYHYCINPSGITQQCRKARGKQLDGFYITRRLLAEREVLGITPTPHCFRFFLLDLRFNAQRLLPLRNRALNRAVFEASARLCRRYFPTSSSAHLSLRDQRLHEALMKGNYWLYWVQIVG